MKKCLQLALAGAVTMVIVFGAVSATSAHTQSLLPYCPAFCPGIGNGCEVNTGACWCGGDPGTPQNLKADCHEYCTTACYW